MEQLALFTLADTTEQAFDAAEAMRRARTRAPLSQPAWTGWTFDAEGEPFPSSYVHDKVWWLNEYYADSWDGYPMSGDDTVRSQAWTEASGHAVRFQLGVDIETGDLSVNDHKGRNIYVLPLSDLRAALACRRSRP